MFTINVSYTQIITISQNGRTIVPSADRNNQTIAGAFTQKISGTRNEFNSSQTNESLVLD